MGKPVVVTIVGDNRGLNRSLNESQGRLSKFGGVAKAGGLAIASGLAVAGAGAVAFGVSAISAASDAQQSIGATETVFGKFAGSIIKNSNKAARAVGLSANEYRENANLIGSLFRNQGVASDKLAGKTDKMIKTAADLAATFGGKTSDAVEALGSAFKGEFDPLERYGISIKQSTINAELAAKGQDKLTGAALKQAQQQATTNLIMKQAGGALGSFSRENDTAAHQSQVLGAQWENLKAKAGTGLLPIVTKLAVVTNDKLIPAIGKAATWFRVNLMPPLRELGEKIMKGLRDNFDDFKAALKDARPALELYGNYIKNVLLPVLKRAAEVILPAIGLALRAVGKGLGALGTIATFTWNHVLAPVFRFFATAVSKVLGGLGKMFSALGHVPGMGWAKRAGKDLQAAATAASDLAAGIKAIPDKKSVKFSLVLSPRDRAILENKNNAFVSSVLNASPRVSTSTSGQSVAPRIAPTVLMPGTTAAAPTVNITVQVPVGASGVDIGRELAGYLDQYFAIGGKRP